MEGNWPQKAPIVPYETSPRREESRRVQHSQVHHAQFMQYPMLCALCSAVLIVPRPIRHVGVDRGCNHADLTHRYLQARTYM